MSILGRQQFPKVGLERVSKFSLRRPMKTRVKKTSKPQKAPIGLFGEKKEWHRRELKRRFRGKASPLIPGTRKSYTRRERGEMIDKQFPWKRFKSHISKDEARERLRELRREEYRARTGAEKREFRRQRQYLARELGLKGKH